MDFFYSPTVCCSIRKSWFVICYFCHNDQYCTDSSRHKGACILSLACSGVHKMPCAFDFLSFFFFYYGFSLVWGKRNEAWCGKKVDKQAFVPNVCIKLGYIYVQVILESSFVATLVPWKFGLQKSWKSVWLESVTSIQCCELNNIYKLNYKTVQIHF